MATSDRSHRVFDRLFDAAVPALLDGTHRQDQPPVDGGRWPVSVACVPDTSVRRVLAAGCTRATHPVRMRLSGVTLSTGAVMAQAEPVDFLLDSLSLVRFSYRQANGTRVMAMEPWHTVPLQEPSVSD